MSGNITTANRVQVWELSRRRLIPATVVGSFIEWYDIAIYGQAAALVFGSLFFTSDDSVAGRAAAFATFGVGYFARPIGAIIFGHIGDKHGRRVSLVATLLLMGVSTTLIGVLPTYAQAGVIAPILLVVLRLLQGAAVGAEYVGAVTMVAEFAPKERRSYFSALPATGVFLGIGFAAAVNALMSLLSEDQLTSWGWRVPFLLSIVVVGVGLILRLRVPESPVFERINEAKRRVRLPAWEVLKRMPGKLLLVMIANTPLAFTIYVVQTFSLGYLSDLGVSSGVSLAALLIGCAAGAVVIPVVGTISDRTGRRPVYIGVALFSAAVGFPFFWLIDTTNPAAIIVAFVLALGGGCLAMFGSQAAYFAELFSAKFRFSGFALGREIPGALLAGPAPLIATGLTVLAGGRPWLVAAGVVLVGLASALATWALPETRGIDLHVVEDETD